MMHVTKIMLACWLLAASVSYAAEPAVSASALAEMMKQAKYSDGFEARVNVLITRANGAHPAPFKLAMIGQFDANKQRLVVRGISPGSVRNYFYAAEGGSDGRIRAVASRHAGEYIGFDPNSGMFDSGLIVWDMFGPWWNWPKQTLEGMKKVNGRECSQIRSATDDKNSVIQEIESCVDIQARLALRTRFFDGTHTLQRTTVVTQLAHKGDSGAMMAKKLNITDAGKVFTEIEVYAGDEQYQISAETFAMFDSQTRNAQREAK